MKYLALIIFVCSVACSQVEEKVVKEVEVEGERVIEKAVETIIFDETGIKVEFPNPAQNTESANNSQEKF